MITIFSRITNELASWITIWRFLRGLDCYGWNKSAIPCARSTRRLGSLCRASSGVFHMSTQYTFQGGTGTFKDAKGTLENHGEADTNRGLVTLGYSGRICGVSR